MHSSGYTLVELLVVIAIIALLAVVGFVSFRGFSEKQGPKNAAGQIQSLIRLAQSNATSSTMCNGQPAESWYLVFTDTVVDLYCNPGETWQRSYYLPAQITTADDSGCTNDWVAILSYSAGTGKQTLFKVLSDGSLEECSRYSRITFTLYNLEDDIASPRQPTASFKVSKGGAVNVQ